MANKIIDIGVFVITLILLVLILGSPLVVATPFIVPQQVPQSTNYSLKLPCTNNGTDCSLSSSCNITLTNPNGTNIFTNEPLSTSFFPLWNITLSDTQTSTLGWYNGYYVCDVGSASGKEQVQFEVTGYGNPEPSGSVIVFFSIVMLLIFGGMLFAFFHSVGHAFALDFDLRDLSWNWGILFIFYAVTYLAKMYLGNPDIVRFMNPVLIVSVFFNGLIPILSFVLSITVGTLMRTKYNKGGDYLDGQI